MKETIRKTEISSGKSKLELKLIHGEWNLPYLELSQKEKGEKVIGTIRLNPKILHELVENLKSFDQGLSQPNISANLNKEIAARYLKGIEINEISIHFDLSKHLIETILENQGISIVPQKYKKRTRWRKK